MKKILLATRNQNKLVEIKRIVSNPDIELIGLNNTDFKDDIIEDGTTFKENAFIKASTTYKNIGIPTVADDSGLVVDALNGQPGIHSARFAGKNATYKDLVNKVLALMKDVPEEKRTARFICVICYYDGNIEKYFKGITEGKITFEPTGQNGFGYDPIFFSDIYNKTFAELTMQQKNDISHRGKAFQLFAEYINTKFL